MNIRWNIQRKLNALLTLCGLLFIGISAPIISYFGFVEYERDAQLQQSRLVGAVKTSAAIATFVANEEIAMEVINGLLQDDEILAVTLIGTEGFEMHAQSQDGTPASHNDQTAAHYPLVSPVDGTTPIGMIKVWPNEALIAVRARRGVVNNLALLAGMTFMLAIVSMFAATVLVGRPLRRLADQVSDAKPATSKKIDVEPLHAEDEIGLVTASVNNFLSMTRSAIEKERELHSQIEKMNLHFSNIFATSHVGIMVVDERGLLLHHNPVLFERIIKLDTSQQQALSSREVFVLAFEDAEDIWNLVDIARTNGETVDADLPLQAAWNQPCWVHCILSVSRDEQSMEEVIEIVLYDVTRRVHEAEAARQLAELDPLTGLHNRRGFDNYLQQRLRRPEARAQLVAMLLDLDGFKPINDQYGHGAGDLVLQTIARRLQGEVRSNTDLVGRIGGDEFVVFLKTRIDSRDLINQIAGKILRRIAEPILVNEKTSVEIGVSIGIAFAANFDKPEALLRAADEAMYTVKLRGKNDFAFAETA